MAHAHKSEPGGPFRSPERLLNRKMLRALVPVSDMTIWRWERDGCFPVHLSVNGRNYWRNTEVMDWLERQRRGRVPMTVRDPA